MFLLLQSEDEALQRALELSLAETKPQVPRYLLSGERVGCGQGLCLEGGRWDHTNPMQDNSEELGLKIKLLNYMTFDKFFNPLGS